MTRKRIVPHSVHHPLPSLVFLTVFNSYVCCVKASAFFHRRTPAYIAAIDFCFYYYFWWSLSWKMKHNAVLPRQYSLISHTQNKKKGFPAGHLAWNSTLTIRAIAFTVAAFPWVLLYSLMSILKGTELFSIVFFVLFLTIILVHFKMINKKNSTSTKELRVLFLYLYGPRGLRLPKNAPEVTSYYFHLYQINPVSATQVFYHGSQWCWCPLGTEWPEVVRYRILKNFCNSNDQGINFTWIFDFSCT